MKTRKNRRNINVMVFLVVAIVALLAIVYASTRKPESTRSNVKANSVASANSTQKQNLVATQRPSLAYYQTGVSGNLFTNPANETAPVSTTATQLPPVNSAPVVVDPLGDYSYTGTVTFDGQTLALVENKKTNDGQYLKCGDTFLGGSVKSITDSSITLTIAGKPRTMDKTDNFKLVPLDKDAVMPKQTEATPEKGKTDNKTETDNNNDNQNFNRANFFQQFRGRFRGRFQGGPGGFPPPPGGFGG